MLETGWDESALEVLSTRKSLRNPLIILLHLLLTGKMGPVFGREPCSAFKDCCVSRIVTAEQAVGSFAVPQWVARNQLKLHTAELSGLWDYLLLLLGNGFSKTCLEY